jgi:hypothetical protein
MSVFEYLPESWKERLRARCGAITPSARLKNLRHAGFSPRRIIDGGAYLGHWPHSRTRSFPKPNYFEPQPSLVVPLQDLGRRLGNARLAPVALHRNSGESSLLLDKSNSRLVGQEHSGSAPIRVSVSTVADVIASNGWPGDFL